MSFIKITTMHPGGRETVGITQQTHVTAKEAFDNRVKRLRATPGQKYAVEEATLSIHLWPTEIFDYDQRLEYAETIEAFDNIQPELPQEFLDLMEKP